MRYHVLATDYDGTLAHDGVVDAETIEALTRLRSSGRRLVLVTGRELDDLRATFPRLDLFDRAVVENGALLYDPASRSERPLAAPADPRFVAALRERGVEPLSVGRVIVATWEPNERAVLETIRELGLELQVVFNKGAVMVLPAGVNKASGLAAALDDLAISPHNVVGIGDAENDHAFLAACEAAVAVANALPALKERCDLVTDGARGLGVAELVDRLLDDDLRSLEPALSRHEVLLGNSGARHGEVRISPYGHNVLVAGPSGSGKSSLVTGILERLAETGYQFCLVDPEGDYAEVGAAAERGSATVAGAVAGAGEAAGLGSAVVLGDADRPPSDEEAFAVLAKPGRSVALNLLGIPLDDRPGYCQALLPRVTELRTATGRPHWLVVDEAHHLFPAGWEPIPEAVPRELESALLVTVHADRVAPGVLTAIDTVLAVGADPAGTMRGFASAAANAGRDVRLPDEPLPEEVPTGHALMWRPDDGVLVRFAVAPAARELGRHRRKYAAGDLPAERAFFFRGPRGKLNLKAQNLELFLQLGEGVDDETWRFHLERGDYSRWMREMIKDPDLAGAVAEVERRGASTAESRSAIRDVVERRYTARA